MNLADILLLKFPNADFTHDIRLQDDGEGIYIKEWNLPNPAPTQQDLNQWVAELDLMYRQKIARDARVYPTWQEQEDMKYHDAINGTTIWIDTLTAIKQTHPIPQE